MSTHEQLDSPEWLCEKAFRLLGMSALDEYQSAVLGINGDSDVPEKTSLAEQLLARCEMLAQARGEPVQLDLENAFAEFFRLLDGS